MLERIRNISPPAIGRPVVIVVIALAAFMLATLSGNFVYLLNTVEAQEIGVQFRQGRVYEVVDPGVYSDVGVYVRLETISTQAIPFEVQDEEIITKDKQRIGLIVSGDIFRPTDKDTIRTLWAQYRGVYLDDELAVNRTKGLTRQAMKVCVGDRTFDNNIIGTSRDALRACVDTELSKLAAAYGLTVENLVVPEVILSPAVQVALDAIVQSRLETEKAAQDELRAAAEANAEQAKQEGEIRVAQSRLQEETRAQTELAKLEQLRLTAQLGVIEANRANDLLSLETDRQTIEAQKINELLAADKDIEINTKLAEAAVAKAQGDVALEEALAELYADNPSYVSWMIAQSNASALTETDKIIFTTEGTTPSIVLPGPGIVPTIDTSGAATSSQ